MKTYIICCASTQIPYLGKFLFLRYGLKKVDRVGQSVYVTYVCMLTFIGIHMIVDIFSL